MNVKTKDNKETINYEEKENTGIDNPNHKVEVINMKAEASEEVAKVQHRRKVEGSIKIKNTQTQVKVKKDHFLEILKVCFIGDKQSGKTQMINRLKNGKFEDDYIANITYYFIIKLAYFSFNRRADNIEDWRSQRINQGHNCRMPRTANC